jgi:hypothetical protein
METVGYCCSRTRHAAKKFPSCDLLLEADAKRFHATLSVRCESRRAFVTKQGYLGLGPDATQAGDVVVILFGSNVLFVLRESMKDKFQVVGECYIYGIMDGEAIAENRQTEWFVVV